jgi:nitroreductase
MVRAFDQRPIPPATLRRVLESVLHAPSAGFTQGNEFLVLDQPTDRERFWAITNDPRWPYEPRDLAIAPAGLVIPLSNESAYLARYSVPDKA